MAVHIVTRIAGQDYKVTLSRDDAGNYVAEAARLLKAGDSGGTSAPHLRVVDAIKERALTSLFESLQGAGGQRSADLSEGPDAPAA